MRMKFGNILLITSVVFAFACGNNKKGAESASAKMEDTSFDFIADRFADIQVLRYKIHDFDKLSLQQKELAYYLTQAGLSGRDIFYDQKYRYE